MPMSIAKKLLAATLMAALSAPAAAIAMPGQALLAQAGAPLGGALPPKQVEVARGAAPQSEGEGLELAVSQAIYRVDGVTRRASALQSHPLTTGPRITLNPDDASAAGLRDGAMARVANGAGTATLPVATSTGIARGAALVESGYGATAALGAGTVRVEAA